jgi:hypothetical protein
LTEDEDAVGLPGSLRDYETDQSVCPGDDQQFSEELPAADDNQIGEHLICSYAVLCNIWAFLGLIFMLQHAEYRITINEQHFVFC